MSNIFSIDYKKLIVLLLPTMLRKPILFALLKSATKPVVSLYDTFSSNRSRNLYEVEQNGQVCYMRKMLNDNFDRDQRRIYISDGESSEWVFLFQKSTFNSQGGKQPVWVSNEEPVLVPRQGSVSAAGSDFVVNIPVALRGAADENRITALVNYYKLASKRYIINYN